MRQRTHLLTLSLMATAVVAASPAALAQVDVDHTALAEGNVLLVDERPLWGVFSLLAAAELPATSTWTPVVPRTAGLQVGHDPGTPSVPGEVDLQVGLAASTSLAVVDLGAQLLVHHAGGAELILAAAREVGPLALALEASYAEREWTLTPALAFATDAGHTAVVRVEWSPSAGGPPTALLSYGWSFGHDGE